MNLATRFISRLKTHIFGITDIFSMKDKNNSIIDKNSSAQHLKEGSYNSINGREIIRYKRKRLIGKGSFGVVYAAINQKGDLIAVKNKKESNDANLTVISNILFSEELESLSQLNHPNIVKLLGVEFSFKGPVSIVMEYIQGTNLEQIIKANNGLHENQIKSYTKQILNAIVYLHSKDIIHRDIKSSNVMIISNSYVKLIDFGMAKKAFQSAYSPQNDSNSSVVGTVAYMAPELIKFETYDARVDVYSLGVLVFEMGNGEPFYKYGEVPIPISKLSTLINLPRLSPLANNFFQNCLIRSYTMRPLASTLKLHPFITLN